ncbi:DUF2157 domain-containing protein [Halobacillus locisalis]|uniref:DUF2157 domain-containing protein n=1 Tax=Halobacillus locisalis TaxID=220753 RepID=A0A838CRE8_9BACI|nr:DUF2157 domain-containing protein [Halobacillus locisalis]MBA2174524.1 DUF2157 domain-containing protein [Halobacillus locisalis]
MNRDQIIKESKQWLIDGIITEDQREQLIERYPERKRKPLLLTFGAIFIGLGFLTFIASNWSSMDDLIRLSIIIVFLLAFYISGDVVYRKHSKPVGQSLLLIALLIFGAGIFLIGQMYHYTSYTAFPFFVWSLAAYGLWKVSESRTFFIATVVLITIGQMYSGFLFQQYHFWLGALFLIGLGWAVYRQKETELTTLFGVSFIIQSLILVFSEGLDYYWLMILFLLIYLADDLIVKKSQTRVLKTMSIISVFTLHVFGVFLLGYEWVLESSDAAFTFFIVWAVLFVGAVIRAALSSTNYYWVDLVLFVPVFKFPIGDVLSLSLLFIYSLLWLIFGYQTEISRWVNKGTVAFLITTFLAYFQLAWDFMDRSLFFFIGGILLFILSYLLERKRRQVHKGEAK